MAWRPTKTSKPNFHVPSAFGKLRNEKVDAGSGILLTNFNETGLDDIHRYTGSTFPDDDFGWRELGSLQACAQLSETIWVQLGEKLDVF